MKKGFAALAAICLTLAYFVGASVFQYESATLGTAVIAQKSRIKGGNPAVINLSGERITTHQMKILNLAKHVAMEDGNVPEDFQGVVFQETKAGGMKQFRVAGQESGLSTMKRYYGVTQIKLAAAWDVLGRFPEMHRFAESGKFTTDEELVANLILNDEFNVRMGSKYYRLVCSNGVSRDRCITRYNQGVAGAATVDPSNWHYTREVKRHVQTTIKPLNTIAKTQGKDTYAAL